MILCLRCIGLMRAFIRHSLLHIDIGRLAAPHFCHASLFQQPATNGLSISFLARSLLLDGRRIDADAFTIFYDIFAAHRRHEIARLSALSPPGFTRAHDNASIYRFSFALFPPFWRFSFWYTPHTPTLSLFGFSDSFRLSLRLLREVFAFRFSFIYLLFSAFSLFSTDVEILQRHRYTAARHAR